MLTFFALLGIAAAISGALAFAFFWPMALVHLRDRHHERLHYFGQFAFASPQALGWLLAGRYRELRDPSLSGLCTPARIALFSVILSLVVATILYLLRLS